MTNFSILRKCEYDELQNIKLDGLILDLGGSRKSGYYSLIKGDHEFVVANLNTEHGFDIKLDLEINFL